MSLNNLTDKQLAALIDQLQYEAKREGCRLYKPYAKQKAFHNATKNHREVMFSASNQLGKTWASANGLAIWLTGEYPDWWDGRRFEHPINAWAIGLTSESTRDTLQRLLMGRPGEFGTGAIPADCIISYTSSRGVSDALDTVIVRHKSGGQSTLGFRSAGKGREALAGESLHVVQIDEEPDLAVYSECLTRTQARNGLVAITFTPMLGFSSVVKRFFQEKNVDRALVNATIDDAEHYTPEQRASIIAGYPEHEREARARGIPVLGSGRIFPVDEALLKVESFALPRHWPRVVGLDFGWQHPAAAVWLAWDRDNDIVYVTDCFRVKETSIPMQAPLFAARGKWIPVAWPHDGLQHESGSGQTLAQQFREMGVNMLPERATFSDGGNSVEAGLMDMLTRMQTGRFKVFSHMNDWFDEFRIYHRRDGRVVKLDDDLLSATRYGVMMLRFASTEPRTGGKVHQVNFGVRKGGY